MKKAILLSGILAAGAAFATDVESGNAVGALDVTIQTTAAQKQVLVSVPFVGFGSGVAVSVKDMVKTSDLAKGSKLYVPTGTKDEYDTWTLQEDGTWNADVKVKIGVGQTKESDSANQDAASVSRGNAFWIEPVFVGAAASGRIFLIGQGADAAGTSTITPGWNLIGNASVTSKALAFSGNANDQIVVQDNGQLRYYTYVTAESSWCCRENGVIVKGGPTIAAGQGLWYFNGGSADITVEW